MEKELEQFIENYRIVKINDELQYDIIISEIIEFIKLVKQYGYYIDRVSFWERISISMMDRSIGGGGILDPDDREIFWADVYYIDELFSPETETYIIVEYIQKTKKQYPNVELYPAFDISEEADYHLHFGKENEYNEADDWGISALEEAVMNDYFPNRKQPNGVTS